MTGDALILAISGLVQALGPMMAEAKRTLPAAQYAVLKATQAAALAAEAAEEAAWTPVEPPPEAPT